MTDKIEIVKEDLIHALGNQDLEEIYFNGFTISLGNADVVIILKRNERPIATLNASYTIAKTLAEKLGNLVAGFETTIDTTVLTTDNINIKLSEQDDEEN